MRTNQQIDKENWSIPRRKIHIVMFGTNTPMGKFFDVMLLVFILLSVLVVMLESVNEIHIRYAELFVILEWFFTISFTIEYGLRLYASYKPRSYATSFFGIVDLLAILPTYLSLIFVGTHYLVVIRALRLMRVFRILKLGHYTKEGRFIMEALQSSRTKIAVFLLFVLLLVTILGAVMYFVEGGVNPGFTSIPRSIYWSIVTLTTVGFGDITPVTPFGQFLAAVIMLLGYAIIAVPTGIVSAEMAITKVEHEKTIACPGCGRDVHDDDAAYCKNCGTKLIE